LLRLIAFTVALSSGAVAQQPACLDARNLPVTVREAPIPDFGHASLDKAGKPVITLNAPLMKKLPPRVGEFIVYHECGHQALGHLLGAGSTLTDEPAADCWAVRSLLLTGRIEPSDIRTISDSIGRLNHPTMNAEPGAEPWRAANLQACAVGLPAATRAPEDDDLARFFQWPMIGSQSAGTHFFLRTRLRGGALQYVATVTDSKGRTAKYFGKGGPPGNLFQIAFSNGAGSQVFTLTIPDSSFVKIGDRAYLEAVGESPCGEDVYRAALQGAAKTASSEHSSHSWIVPAALR
jgi:hypothetical protein